MIAISGPAAAAANSPDAARDLGTCMPECLYRISAGAPALPLLRAVAGGSGRCAPIRSAIVRATSRQW